jgi:tetratricopeptide (TPR) repeat protein
MKENILFSIAGIFLGFFIGFFIANSTAPPLPGADAVSPSQGGPGTQVRGDEPLPPNHPKLDEGSAGSAAASSAQAQAAMDTADRNPKDFTAQIKAAATFYQLGSLDKAALYLDRALALKPNDPDALTGMAHTKYDTGDFTGAATYYEKVLMQRPGDADLLADFGSTYARRTPPDYDRAIKEYRKALAIDPKHEQSLARLADVSISKGDKETARDAIDKLASVNPASPVLQTLRSNLAAK